MLFGLTTLIIIIATNNGSNFEKKARAYAKSIKHAGGRHDTHIGLGLKMENDDASIEQ